MTWGLLFSPLFEATLVDGPESEPSPPALLNVLAWSDALAAVARQVREAPDLAQARTLTPALRRLAQQLLQGRDADGDGRVTFATGEPGLQLLQVSVRTRAGTPPPRAATASPLPSMEVGR